MRTYAAALCILATGWLAAAQPAASPVPAPRARSDSSIAPPPVAREFRGVWVATVNNIDWPSKPGLSTVQQQRELLAILDRAAALHLNAVIFQVRTSADALYQSNQEPWSTFLTGRMGRAPDPVWDPLAFAVREAHARGMELHAWFNPFRARYPGDTGVAAPNHVSQMTPDIVYTYGPYQWMDPGSAIARARALRVILDVVARYDIDGVHVDDTFYPYPVMRGGREVEFPDSATYRAYRISGGTLSRDDWRRANIDRFVRTLYTDVKRTKPWVKVGISPFGIWRPGNPPSVQGFDAYAKLYADSRMWLDSGWVDYLAPQLYWRIGQQGQAYPDLLTWWVQQNRLGRHLWPGHYAMRVADGGGTGRPWPASEIVAQIGLTRADSGADGDIFFSMSALMTDPDSLDEKLLAGPYAEPALVPASPWLDSIAPVAPVVRAGRVADSVTLVRFYPNTSQEPAWWVIQARSAGIWHTAILSGDAQSDTLTGAAGNADLVSVIVVDHAGNESPPALVLLPNGDAVGGAVDSSGARPAFPTADTSGGIVHEQHRASGSR